jgi:hypothetical protein
VLLVVAIAIAWGQAWLLALAGPPGDVVELGPAESRAAWRHLAPDPDRPSGGAATSIDVPRPALPFHPIVAGLAVNTGLALALLVGLSATWRRIRAEPASVQ